MQDAETTAAELPNGPARVTTDNRKDRFKLEYGGQTIFQAIVKVVREDGELGFKDAGARLFVVSKFEGWDVVTQTIRVAAVGCRPGDRIVVRGHAPDSGTGLSTTVHQPAAIYADSQDWRLAVDTAADFTAVCEEEIAVKGNPDLRHTRLSLSAGGPEILLCFRPYYRQRHAPAS